MITKLKQFFSATLGENTDSILADKHQSKLLAAVALMVEIIAVDDNEHETEKKLLRELLMQQFDIKLGVVEKLISDAEQAHQTATDFYHFTAEINAQFNEAEKIELIESLWQLAWADNEIHELEQHVIRRLATLLHVSHKDFIAAKIRVTEKA